jgi:hypothetical protein
LKNNYYLPPLVAVTFSGFYGGYAASNIHCAYSSSLPYYNAETQHNITTPATGRNSVGETVANSWRTQEKYNLFRKLVLTTCVSMFRMINVEAFCMTNDEAEIYAASLKAKFWKNGDD